MSDRGHDNVMVPPGEPENAEAAKVFLRLLAIEGDGPEADPIVSTGSKAVYQISFLGPDRLHFGALRIYSIKHRYRIVLHFTDSPKKDDGPPPIKVVTADDETAKELDNLFAAAIAKKEAGEYK